MWLLLLVSLLWLLREMFLVCFPWALENPSAVGAAAVATALGTTLVKKKRESATGCERMKFHNVPNLTTSLDRVTVRQRAATH